MPSEQAVKFAEELKKEYAKKQKRLEDKVSDAINKLIFKARIETEKAVAELNEEYDYRLNREIQQLIDRFDFEVKKEVMLLKHKILKKAEENLLDCVRNAVKSDYPSVIKALFKEVKPYLDGATIFVRNQDIKVFKRVMEEEGINNVALSTDTAIKEGGFKLLTKDGKVWIDNRLETRIRKAVSLLKEFCGKILKNIEAQRSKL